MMPQIFFIVGIQIRDPKSNPLHVFQCKPKILEKLKKLLDCKQQNFNFISLKRASTTPSVTVRGYF